MIWVNWYGNCLSNIPILVFHVKHTYSGTPMLRTETPEVEERRLKLELRLAKMSEVDGCKEDFLKYVRKVWPEFIAGAHHRMIAKKFEDIANGKNKRLIINMPPRHTNPSLQVISFLHGSLAVIRRPRSSRPHIPQS